MPNEIKQFVGIAELMTRLEIKQIELKESTGVKGITKYKLILTNLNDKNVILSFVFDRTDTMRNDPDG